MERILILQDIHDRYKVLDGAMDGRSSRGRWNGAFKSSNVRRDLDGLQWTRLIGGIVKGVLE